VTYWSKASWCSKGRRSPWLNTRHPAPRSTRSSSWAIRPQSSGDGERPMRCCYGRSGPRADPRPTGTCAPNCRDQVPHWWWATADLAGDAKACCQTADAGHRCGSKRPAWRPASRPGDRPAQPLRANSLGPGLVVALITAGNGIWPPPPPGSLDRAWRPPPASLPYTSGRSDLRQAARSSRRELITGEEGSPGSACSILRVYFSRPRV